MAWSQQRTLVPQGIFFKDSLAVGEHLKYALTYTYPKETDLIFPDSTYDFFPFEYVDKQYFPTRGDSTLLTDSVIYTLTTFEVDPVLYLSTPVFVLNEGDSTRFYSNIDSVFLRQLVDTLPQDPKMESNTDFMAVTKNFNYTYFLIGAGVLLLVVSVIAIFFGKRIVSWFRIKRLKRAHRKFHDKVKMLLNGHSGAFDKNVTEGLLRLWKNYMEKLEKRPFTKLTTREITFIYNDAELNQSLREVDKALYGGYVPEKQNVIFGNLIDFSNSRLRHKIEELKHG